MLYVLIVRIVFCFNNYLIPIGSVVDQVSPHTSHLASLVQNYYDIREIRSPYYSVMLQRDIQLSLSGMTMC